MIYPPIPCQQLLDDDTRLKPEDERIPVFNMKGKKLTRYEGEPITYWVIKAHLTHGPPQADNKTKTWVHQEIKQYSLEAYGTDYRLVKAFADKHGLQVYVIKGDQQFHYFSGETDEKQT